MFQSLSLSTIGGNVFRLAAGGAFTHCHSFGKPHFNYTKKGSIEALHPRLRQADVGGCVSFCPFVKTLFLIGLPVELNTITLRREEFEKLSEFLYNSWRAYIHRFTLEGKLRDRQSTVRSNTVLRTAHDRLFFILYHLKGNTLQELMAITFEMTQPQVSIWIKLLSKLLRDALDKQRFLPVRKAEQLKKILDKESAVILDGVEREIQRPKDHEV